MFALVVRVAICACGLLGAVVGLPTTAAAQDEVESANTPIHHLIVLMQENHTFDNYFGTYPGADGLPPDTCMPVEPGRSELGCVEPFHLGGRAIEDLDHSRATYEAQYNNGRMDGFVSALNRIRQDGEQAMGYYDARDIPYHWNIASQYVLFDRFFSSDHGGSRENHMFWAAAQAGSSRDPITNCIDDLTTIFDRLEEKRISWKFYIQNYDDSLTCRTVGDYEGDPNRLSQVTWVPLLNLPRYLDDAELFSHIVPLDQYYEDLHQGTLPAVAYITPSGSSEHPPGSLIAGQRFVRGLVNALMQSEAWSGSAFLVTYDDWGGWYDHVTPPQVDDHGYGFRVPAFLVSPYARRGYIDHTELDFTSILAFIEENYDLEPIASRDARANSIASAFDFSRPAREPRIILFDRPRPEPPGGPPRSLLLGAYGGAIVVGGMLVATGFLGGALSRRRAAGVVVPLKTVAMVQAEIAPPTTKSQAPSSSVVVVVPDTLGLSVADARQELIDAGLRLDHIEPVAGPPGKVVRSDPSPREGVSRGHRVVLFVGVEPERLKGTP